MMNRNQEGIKVLIQLGLQNNWHSDQDRPRPGRSRLAVANKPWNKA
jgi:hypothetical protein